MGRISRSTSFCQIIGEKDGDEDGNKREQGKQTYSIVVNTSSQTNTSPSRKQQRMCQNESNRDFLSPTEERIIQILHWK